MKPWAVQYSDRKEGGSHGRSSGYGRGGLRRVLCRAARDPSHRARRLWRGIGLVWGSTCSNHDRRDGPGLVGLGVGPSRRSYASGPPFCIDTLAYGCRHAGACGCYCLAMAGASRRLCTEPTVTLASSGTSAPGPTIRFFGIDETIACAPFHPPFLRGNLNAVFDPINLHRRAHGDCARGQCTGWCRTWSHRQ